jgi:hypothetical protein
MATGSSSKASGEKGSDSSLASLLNVVPTIYYDLIARICPGMAFWLAIALGGSDLGRLAELKKLATENVLILGACRKKTFVNGVRKQIFDNAACNSNLPRTPRAGWSP